MTKSSKSGKKDKQPNILVIWGGGDEGFRADRGKLSSVDEEAYGPRKGLNPPRNIKPSETLTSSPRDADAGRIRKEGVYVRFAIARPSLARISPKAR
jgi:hypothetical protein